MALSRESPSDILNTSEEYPDGSSLYKESKRKKFHPFRAVRNIFRRRLRRVDSEEFHQSVNKSRSTIELLDPKTDAKARFPTAGAYAVGLSVSHDSIFSPDPSTISLDLSQHCTDFKSELMARLQARRSSEDEDDVGLPHSPCTSPTTAEVLAQSMKAKSGTKLSTTCSAGSLLSMASSENDEDIFGAGNHLNTSKSSLGDLKSSDLNQSTPLSHSAAHHKISIRPKRNHAKPLRSKQQVCPSNLPSTPEVCEISFPGESEITMEEQNARPPLPETKKLPDLTRKSSGDKKIKEDSKSMFSMFRTRKGSDTEPPPPEEPFFTRLFGSRRSNRKSKKPPQTEECKTEHYRVLESESSSFSSSPKHSSYLYSTDCRMIPNIMPPMNVPKPISLMDSRSHSNSDPRNGFYSKDKLITRVDESQNSMPRSQSYSNHKELEDAFGKENQKMFPQSTSFDLFPKTVTSEVKHEDAKPNSIRNQDSAKPRDHKILPNLPLSISSLLDYSDAPKLEKSKLISEDKKTWNGSKSEQSCDPFDIYNLGNSLKRDTKIKDDIVQSSSSSYFSVENAVHSYLDHDVPSISSLDSLSSLDQTGSKLIESREKLLDFLDPTKQNSLENGLTKLDDSSQFSSLQESQKSIPFVPKALRSHSFKEYDKQSPKKTKKQSTLPPILSKEDYDLFHSKDIKTETNKDVLRPSLDSNKNLIKVPPQVSNIVVNDNNNKVKETSSSSNTNDLQISAPNPTFIKQEVSKLRNINLPTSKYIYESENHVNKELVANQSNIKTEPSLKRTESHVLKDKKEKEELSEPASKYLIKTTNSSSKLSQAIEVETSLPPIVRPNKLNLIETTKDTPTKEDREEFAIPTDPPKVSLVKRNKEMFRQLESKNTTGSNSNKRNSLPIKISTDKETSLPKKDYGTPQTTPCTTPLDQAESELLSVFSKRSSKKIEDVQLKNIVTPTTPNETAKKNMSNNINNNGFTDLNQNNNIIIKDIPRKQSIRAVQRDGFLPPPKPLLPVNNTKEQKQDGIIKEPSVSVNSKNTESTNGISKVIPDNASKITKESSISAKNTCDNNKVQDIFLKSNNLPLPKKEEQRDIAKPKQQTNNNALYKNSINTSKDKQVVENSIKEFVIPKAKEIESPKKEPKEVKDPLQCQRSRSLKCSNLNNEKNKNQQSPPWLILAHQRRDERQTTERRVSGSSEAVISTIPNSKGSRSSKVLDMVNSYQKLQM